MLFLPGRYLFLSWLALRRKGSITLKHLLDVRLASEGVKLPVLRHVLAPHLLHSVKLMTCLRGSHDLLLHHTIYGRLFKHN